MNTIGAINTRKILFKALSYCAADMIESNVFWSDEQLNEIDLTPGNFMALMTDSEVDSWWSNIESGGVLEMCQIEHDEFDFVIR